MARFSKFTFKFLFANGSTAHLTFQAVEYKNAHEAAAAYARLATGVDLVYDFYWEP